MEEIKNWWGVFGLFDCVTVVLSSLERRCHRQGSLAALTNPAISFPFRVSGKRCSVAHTDSARIKMLCMSPSPKTYAFSLDLFNNASSFFIPWLSAWFFFDLFSSAWPFWVDVLVGLVTQSASTEPLSTSITFTTPVCWNCLRLLFIVVLLLDPSQLYSVSTVAVYP